jgi:prevent-host-death family protein
MSNEVSKSEFKARALEILRAVEATGEPVYVTDRGVPTVEVRRYRKRGRDPKKTLQDSVVSFKNPTQPTDEPWEVIG